MKDTLRRRAPRTFAVLAAIKGRVMIELRIVRRLRLRDLLRTVGPLKSAWERELPVQRALEHTVVTTTHAARGDIVQMIESAGATLATGVHTVYLSPSEWRRGPLASLASLYPDDAGIKIMRNMGDLSAPYLHGDGHSHVHTAIMLGHEQLALVANHLHLLGLGPRVYDVTTLQWGQHRHVAYVVQHVVGRQPTTEEWSRGIARLKAACAGTTLGLIVPGGFDHIDFRAPDCNGNAFVTEAGSFQYVDFQNFVLRDYAQFLVPLAKQAAEASHFGDRSLLRGGAYLYQAIPAVPLPAKRDPSVRMRTIRESLKAAGTGVRDRIVLDIGCNIGMMATQYLGEGAAWVHGWDRPKVVPEAERLLLAIGSTRFTLTPTNLERTSALLADLPAFLRSHATGCVVSYLAVRGHLGWIDALHDIPWSTLVYEGHEGEDEEATRAFLLDLRAIVPCEIASLTTYRDGDSDTRVIAILARQRTT